MADVLRLRHRVLLITLGVALAFHGLVRLGLTAWNGDLSLWAPWRLGPALAIGAVFDAAAAVHVLAVLALPLMLWPVRPGAWQWALRLWWAVVVLAWSVFSSFVAFSEFTFWNEFASRFNFIAVDYLIYTAEVVGNIRESYHLPTLFAGVGAVALLLALAWWRATRGCWPAVQATALVVPTWRQRLTAWACWAVLPLVAYGAVDQRYKEFSEHAQLNELAGNGPYDFLHAFRFNAIDYERFYTVLPLERAQAVLASELNTSPTGEGLPRPFVREVKVAEAPKPWNVVLVSIESLGASFLAHHGNTQGLTPHLDAMAAEGLWFSQMYATGTRTVRGLEALALSVPPTPGHSIVKRPRNEDLFTVGEVFKSKGYEPLYIYGGYGYFDNMTAFFGGNGYTVVDRSQLPKEDIHFENIWGVADEDLFTLTLRQLDDRHARGVPFFAHVMTTSNHRPYSYPEGRIDIPSGTGRDGAVKYTDWAIGDFMKRARGKPWFAKTLFVFVADHTHNGRGKKELPPPAYHIPCIVYAPGLVSPRRVDTLASQIDVAPTVLGLMNFSYRSGFFGHDVLREGAKHPRAFMANYQTVGYWEDGVIVELKPNQRVRVVEADSGEPLPAPEAAAQQHRVEEAIAYYQMASRAFNNGDLRAARAAR